MFKRLALQVAVGVGILTALSVVNDRGGYLKIDNVLNVGREFIETRSPAKAAQGSGCLPTTGTVSGLTFAQGVNSAVAALISNNSGASPPSTDCSGTPVKGQMWLDTSVTPNVLKQYDGTAWAFLGALDASNHLWAPPVGGGTATLASQAGITDLWANPASSITISGTNAITGLANASAVPGTVKVVTASGAFTLTHNGASLILPSAPATPLAVAPGDRFLAVALSSSNVAVFAYTRADGSAIVNPSVPLATALYGTYGTPPVKTVYGIGQALSRVAYPDFFLASTRQQTVTMTAGQPTLTNVANTAGLGAGMPLEGPGVPAGATIAAVTLNSIVMSANASLTGNNPVRAFITGYGAGGDSNTVGVIDCRGRALAGRDDMGGTAANRLTAASFPDPTRINAAGGVDGFYFEQKQLPNAAVPLSGTADPVSVVSTANNYVSGTPVSMNVGGSDRSYVAIAIGTNGVGPVSSSGTFTPRGSTYINGNQAQSWTKIVQPTVVAECVQVVLP